MSNEITEQQNNTVQAWSGLLEDSVRTTLTKLDGKFIAVSNSAGFYFGIFDSYYNKDTLASLDYLVRKTDDGLALADSFSQIYLKVISKIEYFFSSADEKEMNLERNKNVAKANAVLEEYKRRFKLASIVGVDIHDVMAAVKTKTGCNYDKLDTREYPEFANLCSLLVSYSHDAANTSRLENTKFAADDRLNAIAKNMGVATEENGGLVIEGGRVVPGWDKLLDAAAILDSLQTGPSIKIHLAMDDFHQKDSTLHLGEKHTVALPSSWFFNMKVQGETDYDLSTFAQSGAKAEIDIEFTGVTQIAAVPQPLAIDNTRGWFASDVLLEASEKSGKDVSGYQLKTSDFDPKTLFGPDGQLKRLKTYVISAQPAIHMKLSNFDATQMKSVFAVNNNIDITLFGRFKIGGSGNGYSVKKFDSQGSSQEIEIDIQPVKPGTGNDFFKETAFILGGVPETY
jgi:hypothetical protein